MIAVLAGADIDALAAHLPPRMPVRGIAVSVRTVVVLNTTLWLGGVVPGLVADGRPAFLTAPA